IRAPFFMCYISFLAARPPPALDSCPTRRSSDLLGHLVEAAAQRLAARRGRPALPLDGVQGGFEHLHLRPARRREGGRGALVAPRSEEHTSELQSRRDLVCRLLLEKKNN